MEFSHYNAVFTCIMQELWSLSFRVHCRFVWFISRPSFKILFEFYLIENVPKTFFPLDLTYIQPSKGVLTHKSTVCTFFSGTQKWQMAGSECYKWWMWKWMMEIVWEMQPKYFVHKKLFWVIDFRILFSLCHLKLHYYY